MGVEILGQAMSSSDAVLKFYDLLTNVSYIIFINNS